MYHIVENGRDFVIGTVGSYIRIQTIIFTENRRYQKDKVHMSRISNHKTETAARLIFEEAVSSFSCQAMSITEGDLLFRGIDERDYGIDGELEIFELGEVTSKLARIQLKGTEKVIEKLKTVDCVSCPGVSKSSLGYCRTNNIPFILVYISKADRKFYYCDLQPVYQQALQKIGDGESCTIRIPYDCNSDDLSKLVSIINSYFENTQKKIVGMRADSSFEGKDDEVSSVMDDSDMYDDPKPEDNLWDYPYDVTSYVVKDHQTPADGEHKMVGLYGETVKIGYWKDGELYKGTEYNHLMRVTQGALIFKPGCPEDPYDATDDFEYEKLEMYHWEAFSPFHWSEYSIAEVGFDKCYVVDLEVDGSMEQIVNIRTLEEFLAGKDPRHLKLFKEIVEMDREEIMDSMGIDIEKEKVNSRAHSQLMEALLRERKAKLRNANGSVTDVYYKALDLLQLFMESNYGKKDVADIAEALSIRALENKTEKDTYWKYATVANAIPGMIDKKSIQELVNILRAYKMIDCDREGKFYVTEDGRKATSEGIILLDMSN